MTPLPDIPGFLDVMRHENGPGWFTWEDSGCQMELAYWPNAGGWRVRSIGRNSEGQICSPSCAAPVAEAATLWHLLETARAIPISFQGQHGGPFRFYKSWTSAWASWFGDFRVCLINAWLWVLEQT